MSALPFLWSSGTITLSPWRRQDPALTAHRKTQQLQLHPNFPSVSVMHLEWKCLSGLAPLKPVIGLRPVWGWPAGLTCHSSCLTLSQKSVYVKTGELRFTLRRFSPGVAIPLWLLRLAVMTAKHVLVAGSGSDKSRHVWQRQHNLFYRDTRGDLPLIWCGLIRSHTTNLHRLHSPKPFNPYLPYYKPHLDANPKTFFAMSITVQTTPL